MPRKKNQVRSKKIKEKEKKEDEKEDPYLEEIIDVDEDVAKDFEFLVNAPVSTDDFFVSEAEKSWTVDASKYSEYFTLDLKTLSAAVESIPFNELVDIDAKYFTDDQLTNIHNKAERGKENYNKIINSLKTEDVNDVESLEECQESIEDQTEDLEFLLSLKEPMNDPLMSVKSLSISCNTDTKISTASGASAKPMDLEKWLDSVLDD
ncbi:uncharacterized protein LOC143180317 isoform X2 [Calliopsis andreniformis]|uniref:uncharacterized protein LOC143180317 isoform X2 n=1 Tax=Calliopsis andreniformis TaxID=337506 RepID=UPI003FCD7697